VVHAVEHLRRDNHRLSLSLTFVDDPLLHDGDLGNVHLNSQVATRHHDPFGGCDNFADLLHGLRLLYLGDRHGGRTVRL
jgi:hypothetical protein